MPQIVEFWILQTIIFWIVLFGAIPSNRDKSKRFSTIAALILAALLLIINYFGSIRRLRDINNDWYYLQMRKLEPMLGPKDIVVFKDGWIIKDYVSYFTKTVVVDASFDKKSQSDELLRQAIHDGGRLFLFEQINRADSSHATNYFDSLYSEYTKKAKVLSKEPLIWVIE
jgi:hypothetical protein